MRYRAPTVQDAPAVLAVSVACDIAERGRPDYTLDDLLGDWRASDVVLARDALVATDEAGQIVAYAIVRRFGTMVMVAPGHESRGIGTHMLQWAQLRDRQCGRPRHRQWVGATNTRAAALLRGAGYARVRAYTRMACALDRSLREPDPPPGVTLAALDPSTDARELHALDALSFAANADYEPESFDEFAEEHLGGHDTAPELSLVARRDGAMVGFLIARRFEDQDAGFIDLLAVHPAHRGQGIATALLHTAFARFAVAGLIEAQLGVASDNPTALALYARVGMSPLFAGDTYERAVDD